MSEPLRVHIIYEHGTDLKPFSCSYIRLIRPLTHPTVSDNLIVSYGLDLPEERVDVVILDRLWKPGVSLEMMRELVSCIRQLDAGFIYHLDDNFLDLAVPRKRVYPPAEYVSIVSYLLAQADGVLVSTPALRGRLSVHNSNIRVVPNALDEQLFRANIQAGDSPTNAPGKVKIGYMGTFTHDADLKLILPAMKRVARRHRDDVQFEIMGVIGDRRTTLKLRNIPLQYVSPEIEDIEYVRFLPWFTGNIHWDIALAPLTDTPFTRSKSDIKFLDYAAIGTAGIFSQGPVYSPSVKHLETGWLARNRTKAWDEALETLIADEPLRRKLSQNANRYLHAERTLAQRARDWLKAIRELIACSIS